ncbi:hypothetical protein GY45DRAFT_1324155 [Cubamyces sp. BRFM 1775]|nr:hypothetical protein GY45DRAFT_1324155 [Cubamyces sp. BRFM 1775]
MSTNCSDCLTHNVGLLSAGWYMRSTGIEKLRPPFAAIRHPLKIILSRPTNASTWAYVWL